MSDEEGGSEAEESGTAEEESSPQDSSGNPEDANLLEPGSELGDVAYSTYQMFVFASCFIGHCLYIYNRRVFQFVLPHIMNEGVFSGKEITSIVMLQQVSFTISSFFVGTALDTASAKMLFALGMFTSGFFNFGFSDADDSGNLMLMAALNGICNGFGWPCVVKITRAWFPRVSFGLWWALMSLSFFLVNLVGPPTANSWANDHGWRVAIQMPAVISMVVASALYFLNIDKPSDVGYQNQQFEQANSDAHWTDILGSEFMLVLCGGGFLMTLIRASSADWGQLYLMEERGLSTYNAGGFGFALESGGVFGTTVIGAMADFAIKKDMHIGYYKFPRMILLFISLFGGGIILSSFILGITAYSSALEVNTYAFVMGLTFCAALQNLEAMLIETAPPNKLNSCYALLSFSTNLAAVTAGFPMSFLAAHYGWSRAFLLLNFALLVAFFGLIIGKDLDKSFDPKSTKKKV